MNQLSWSPCAIRAASFAEDVKIHRANLTKVTERVCVCARVSCTGGVEVCVRCVCGGVCEWCVCTPWIKMPEESFVTGPRCFILLYEFNLDYLTPSCTAPVRSD